ncbi:hypothetical protein FIV42_21495 [Persicimonas caeni]|uniref:Uncharacterized protein n=1 Tax=Persicimonas caeni TaxID=2292766 RepID=A0A4Y6PYZ8_PERCE|nr:hypothetical protein [Persicimonas caeni]QDG53227.1 hypothetical protein FIV42_21495 [Persicimonas caeni]QED34449.1 hypothetical protein FRD00_21490 [Persicimonas caeni]
MTEQSIEELKNAALDTSERAQPSVWEERFETQVNTFFDEAIGRVPGFVDRHLTSLRRVIARSVGPRTGIADVFISARNMAAGVSKAVGGPDFSTSTYTADKLTEAFEREVVSSDELESLLRRLFKEFEEDQWQQASERMPTRADASVEEVRERLLESMEEEIAHDPLLAQAIRSGVKIGLPATLGYVLFGKFSFFGVGSEAAGEIYRSRLNFYNRALMKLGRFQVPGWVGAVGLAGGVLGSLVIGGVMEYALNSIRDVKGAYIRQLNAARHALLYGENPEVPEGQGILHVVRGLERQFERLPEATEDLIEMPQQGIGDTQSEQEDRKG